MSSTEWEGILAGEKKKLYEIALASDGTIRFPERDEKVASYYLDYQEARHLDHTGTAYDSTEISGMRTMLTELWRDDPQKAACIPVLLAAYRRTQEETGNYLPEIDLHNYMM